VVSTGLDAVFLVGTALVALAESAVVAAITGRLRGAVIPWSLMAPAASCAQASLLCFSARASIEPGCRWILAV
jgi:hypothetical protein